MAVQLNHDTERLHQGTTEDEATCKGRTGERSGRVSKRVETPAACRAAATMAPACSKCPTGVGTGDHEDSRMSQASAIRRARRYPRGGLGGLVLGLLAVLLVDVLPRAEAVYACSSDGDCAQLRGVQRRIVLVVFQQLQQWGLGHLLLRPFATEKFARGLKRGVFTRGVPIHPPASRVCSALMARMEVATRPVHRALRRQDITVQVDLPHLKA